MYYLLLILLLSLLLYVITKVASALLKGCLSVVFSVLVVYFIFLLFKSIKAPVNLFNLYRIDNFKIEKVN